jgi:hypothetical protein
MQEGLLGFVPHNRSSKQEVAESVPTQVTKTLEVELPGKKQQVWLYVISVAYAAVFVLFFALYLWPQMVDKWFINYAGPILVLIGYFLFVILVYVFALLPFLV